MTDTTSDPLRGFKANPMGELGVTKFSSLMAADAAAVRPTRTMTENAALRAQVDSRKMERLFMAKRAAGQQLPFFGNRGVGVWECIAA